HTIKTFSWLQGNPYPGFALLTLVPPPPAANTSIVDPGATTLAVAKCALPPQLYIYAWYLALAALSLLACFLHALLDARASPSRLPLARRYWPFALVPSADPEADDDYDGGHRGRGKNRSPAPTAASASAVARSAALLFAETVLAAGASHAAALAISVWL
ncbi:hypothetical protein HK405_015207, partial [Cladochytrium tenue]